MAKQNLRDGNKNSVVNFGAGWLVILYCLLMFFLYVGMCNDGANITAPNVAFRLGLEQGDIMNMNSLAGIVGVVFFIIVGQINNKIGKIVKIVEQVSGLSTDQLESVKHVAESVAQITEAATSNAAVSEESDASSQEMSRQAAFLRNRMQHFNLRARQKGQAYIPNEKQNDAEFIKYANEAYKIKETTGQFGNEYIDPYGQQLEERLMEADHKRAARDG